MEYCRVCIFSHPPSLSHTHHHPHQRHDLLHCKLKSHILRIWPRRLLETWKITEVRSAPCVHHNKLFTLQKALLVPQRQIQPCNPQRFDSTATHSQHGCLPPGREGAAITAGVARGGAPVSASREGYLSDIIAFEVWILRSHHSPRCWQFDDFKHSRLLSCHIQNTCTSHRDTYSYVTIHIYMHH